MQPLPRPVPVLLPKGIGSESLPSLHRLLHQNMARPQRSFCSIHYVLAPGNGKTSLFSWGPARPEGEEERRTSLERFYLVFSGEGWRSFLRREILAVFFFSWGKKEEAIHINMVSTEVNATVGFDLEKGADLG